MCFDPHPGALRTERTAESRGVETEWDSKAVAKAADVMAAVEEASVATGAVAEAVSTVVRERCTKRFAANAKKNVKFHSSLEKIVLYIARIVFPSARMRAVKEIAIY